MNTLTKQQKASRRAKNHRRYEAKKAKRGDKSLRKPAPMSFNTKQAADFVKSVAALSAFLGSRKTVRNGR